MIRFDIGKKVRCYGYVLIHSTSKDTFENGYLCGGDFLTVYENDSSDGFIYLKSKEGNLYRAHKKQCRLVKERKRVWIHEKYFNSTNWSPNGTAVFSKPETVSEGYIEFAEIRRKQR